MKAEVLILKQHAMICQSKLLQRNEVLILHCNWLLAQDIQTSFKTGFRQRKMSRWRRGDMHHVGSYLRNHFLEVGEPSGDGKAFSRRLRTSGRNIAYGRDFDVLEFRERA